MIGLFRNSRLPLTLGLALLALAASALIGARAELVPLVAGGMVGLLVLLMIIRWPMVGVGFTAALVMTGGLSQILSGSIFQRLYVVFFVLTCLAYAHHLLSDRELMRHWLRIRVADVIAVALLVTATLSLVVAPVWHQGLDQYEALLKGLALYVLMSRAIRSVDDLIFVAKFILVGSLWQASTAWTSSQNQAMGNGVTRLSGNLANSNAFAFALLRAFPWALFFCFYGRGIWRWLGLGATLLLSLTALATVSRTAAAVLAVIALFWAIFGSRGFEARLRNVGLVLVVLSIGMLFYGDALLQRWSLLRELTNTSNVEFVVEDDGGRAELRAAALEIIAHNPVLGVGIGNTPFELMQELRRHKPFPVHMMYLEVGADIGLFGLFCFVALAVVGYLRAARLWWRTRDGMRCALIVTCVASLSTWTIFGFSGNWHYINFAYLLVAFVHLLPELIEPQREAVAEPVEPNGAGLQPVAPQRAPA